MRQIGLDSNENENDGSEELQQKPHKPKFSLFKTKLFGGKTQQTERNTARVTHRRSSALAYAPKEHWFALKFHQLVEHKYKFF